ncbi:TRAP transporter substrate-binding protein [Arhodomonas sp. AD133]|uniref:TRAP transporter substrate-binding protein n=1 Tax=Arhodomonas sp. AD133 TaxID=3415009 RepID=UPI003EBDE55D
MKRLLRILCAGTALLAFTAGAQEYTWRFALEEVDGSVQDAYAEQFKKLMEEKTDGAVSVEIYPYGSLGTSDQLTELVQNGSIQFSFASPGHLATLVPEVGVFTLHFVFSDNNEVNREVLRDTEAMPMLEEAYREKDLALLGIIPEGWMTWTANKPLKTVDDFDGLKIRTMTSPLLVKSYEAYGANPTPMPYSEVYSGLQLGIIDAQVNPIFAIEEMSFYEVQEAMTQAKHAQFISTVVTNPGFYEDLPEDIRAAVDEATAELHDYIFTKQAEYNAERLEDIRSNSDIEILEITDEAREAFREASMPVRDVYIEQAGERGEKILNTILEDVKNAESEMEG